METEDLERVIRIARRRLPRGMDYENVAMDVLIESWQNKVEKPSVRFIKNRCWDAIRRMKVELRANEGLAQKTEEHDKEEKKVDHNDLMTKLTKNLTSMEKKVIFYRYYQELGVEEVGKKVGLGKTKAYQTLTEALYKMREEHHE